MECNGDDTERLQKHQIQTHAPDVLAAILETSNLERQVASRNNELNTALLEGLSRTSPASRASHHGDTTRHTQYQSVYNDRCDMSTNDNDLTNEIKGLNFVDAEEVDEDGGILEDSLELSTGTFQEVLEDQGGSSEEQFTRTQPCCSTPMGEIQLQRGTFYNQSGTEEVAILSPKDGDCNNLTENGYHNYTNTQSSENSDKTEKRSSARDNTERTKRETNGDTSSKNVKTKSKNPQSGEKAKTNTQEIPYSKPLPKKKDIIERNINQASQKNKHRSYSQMYSAKGKKDRNSEQRKDQSVQNTESYLTDTSAVSSNVDTDTGSTSEGQGYGNFYPNSYVDYQMYPGNAPHPHNMMPAYMPGYPQGAQYFTPGHYGIDPGRGPQNMVMLDSSYNSSDWHSSLPSNRSTFMPQSDASSMFSQTSFSAPPKTHAYTRSPLVEQVDFDNPDQIGQLSAVLPNREFLDQQPEDRPTLHKRFVSDPQLSRTNPLPPIHGGVAVKEGYSSPKKEINYKPYTLKEFKCLKPVQLSGGLGPKKITDSFAQKMGQISKQREYAEMLRTQHSAQKQKWEKKTTKPTAREESIQQAKKKRQAALEYAKAVPRPQSGSRKKASAGAEKTQTEEKTTDNEEKELTLLELLKMRHEKEKNQIDAIKMDLKTKLR